MFVYIFSTPQVTGVLDDCLCDIDSIDNFNTFKIFPKIKKLQERDYFRYYKVQLQFLIPFVAKVFIQPSTDVTFMTLLKAHFDSSQHPLCVLSLECIKYCGETW